jgi:hypothetical protein
MFCVQLIKSETMTKKENIILIFKHLFFCDLRYPEAVQEIGYNTILNLKATSKDDSLCAGNCYTILEDCCIIHWLQNQLGETDPIMCESYNLYTAGCNTYVPNATHLYQQLKSSSQ